MNYFYFFLNITNTYIIYVLIIYYNNKSYEEPKKAKQSLQKRKSLSNIKIPIPSKKASATIERGFETKEGKLKSGLDLVLLMNADDEAVLKRKTGSKIDTFTGKMYHLEYNPPPENEPVNIYTCYLY